MSFPVVVGIERDSPDSRDLLTLLKATRIFHRVAYLDELHANPDLIATTEHPYGRRGVATIPILSILSLGFIPTVVNEPRQIAFRLTSPKRSDKSLEVSYHARSLTVLGWAAWLLNWFPNWGASDPGVSNDRFDRQIAWILISDSEWISQVTGKPLLSE